MVHSVHAHLDATTAVLLRGGSHYTLQGLFGYAFGAAVIPTQELSSCVK